MSIQYSLLNPSGNVTLLVESPVAAEEQPAVAGRLMAAEPRVEQVGFLSPGVDGAQVSLRMAGGEFCGNATMSAAYWWLRQQRTPGPAQVLVRASGAPAPVSVSLSALEEGSRRGALQMPAPAAVAEVALPLTEEASVLFPECSEAGEVVLPVVTFDGISHVVVSRTSPLNGEERQAAETLIAVWCKTLKAEALGLMFLGAPDREGGRVLTPLVYVPEAETCCWESACGSGSCSVAAYLAEAAGEPFEVTLKQPGGTLTVMVSPDGALTLSGTVSLLSQDIER